MQKLHSRRIFYCLILGNLYLSTMATTIQRANTNLTSILWAHAVNSEKLLEEALEDKIDMIEADIVLGTLINDTSGELFPVMGHPPKNTSDIKLETFLKRILDFNNQNPRRKKGVKLDFKSTEVYEGSLGILSSLWTQMSYPVWLNADIIRGPVNPTNVPVDPNVFLQASKNYLSGVLSIGWTTDWGANYTKGSYTTPQIENMIKAIKDNQITASQHEITFPVRAGIAAQSSSELRHLFTSLNETNKVTLTIWSSNNDSVDIDKLRDLIFEFGLDKVYLDVPEEVASKLNLAGNKGTSFWPSVLQFGLMNLAVFLITKFLTSSK